MKQKDWMYWPNMKPTEVLIWFFVAWCGLMALLFAGCSTVPGPEPEPEVKRERAYVHYAVCQTCEGYKTSTKIADAYPGNPRGHAIVVGPVDYAAGRYEWLRGIGPAPGSEVIAGQPITWAKKGRTNKVRFDNFTSNVYGPQPWKAENDERFVVAGKVVQYPGWTYGIPVFTEGDTLWVKADLMPDGSLRWWDVNKNAVW